MLISALVPGESASGWPARGLYELPCVRRRHAEYLGGSTLEEATAVYVVSPERPPIHESALWPPQRLGELLEAELTAARSLWDRRALLVQLDLEHVHFDRPWEPLVEAERSRRLQRPVVEAIGTLLAGYGIAHLRLLTGRGQHFVWRLDRGSRAFATLARLGSLGDGLQASYRNPFAPVAGAPVVGLRAGAAYEGLGRVLEYLGHRVLERSARCEIPVQITAVTVGPGPRGREIVSFDLSQFGDPLQWRSTRLPFTAYRKMETLSAPAVLAPSELVVVPIVDGDERAARRAARSLEHAAELASACQMSIPEASTATEALIADYLDSDLFRFHSEYEATLCQPRARWMDTYDRLALEELPGCLRRTLEHPNDLLLQPAAIQHVVRGLLAEGWAARDVAGLLRSKYERDYRWIPDVHFHEPGVRAEFYTRLFAGLQACGRDGLVDFNCQSTIEKGLCPRQECRWDLRDLRARLTGEGGAS